MDRVRVGVLHVAVDHQVPTPRDVGRLCAAHGGERLVRSADLTQVEVGGAACVGIQGDLHGAGLAFGIVGRCDPSAAAGCLSDDGRIVIAEPCQPPKQQING